MKDLSTHLNESFETINEASIDVKTLRKHSDDVELFDEVLAKAKMSKNDKIRDVKTALTFANLLHAEMGSAASDSADDLCDVFGIEFDDDKEEYVKS